MNPNSNTFFEKLKPWLISIALLPFSVYYAFNRGEFTFIDYVNLLIHEGGHGIFSFFGKFIYTLGGTLAQILVPGMFVVYYWIKRNRGWTQVFLIWLGENLINISAYAADARAHKLPLLGGNKVYHDWTYLLIQTNLLERDQAVGMFFYCLGIAMFMLSFLMPHLLKQYENTQIKLEI